MNNKNERKIKRGDIYLYDLVTTKAQSNADTDLL